ncbi:hypothetical protein QO002_001189 [Pararhizobium capsulatum DSM 1112]|uniref:DUF4173 domain-containing protein n=1 Tax=Pararhizobium capsulatum DSM 1112 TaxID=1121113 RepID=A0ABU0BLD0_9HYPH|nr:hypothetical protein [Pararhizobium capsulatum]MDQ0319051.1 hypothetical protein [Pararhizobium capsulatum DSM 1112]
MFVLAIMFVYAVVDPARGFPLDSARIFDQSLYAAPAVLFWAFLVHRGNARDRYQWLSLLFFIYVPLVSLAIYNAFFGTVSLFLFGDISDVTELLEYLWSALPSVELLATLGIAVLAAGWGFRLFVPTFKDGQGEDPETARPLTRRALKILACVVVVSLWFDRLPNLLVDFTNTDSQANYDLVFAAACILFVMLVALAANALLATNTFRLARPYIFMAAFTVCYPQVEKLVRSIAASAMTVPVPVAPGVEAQPPSSDFIDPAPLPLPETDWNEYWYILFRQRHPWTLDVTWTESLLLCLIIITSALITFALLRLWIPPDSGQAEDARNTDASGEWPNDASFTGMNDMNEIARLDVASATAESKETFNRLTIVLVTTSVVVLCFTAVLLLGQGFSPLPVVLGTLLSILLAWLPVLISHSQSSTRQQQFQRLGSLAGHPLSQTAYFRAATAILKAQRPVSLNSVYSLPIATLATILTIGFLVIFLATSMTDVFKTQSFLLGGFEALNLKDEAARVRYQQETFVCFAVAFLGSYTSMLFSILFRTQNIDIQPATFYYYSVRLISSTIVAIVLRHVFGALSQDSPSVLILAAFIVGFAPDLFIATMARRAFQFLKMLGSQRDPSEESVPTNLNMLMLEGMSRDKIDRLSELGIDSAQYLACQNPFLLWPRLPYELTLIVDWIAQAQLYRWAKEDRLVAMRGIGINNIIEFHALLRAPDPPDSLLQTLRLERATLATYRESLETDPSFARLQAVQSVLKYSGIEEDRL